MEKESNKLRIFLGLAIAVVGMILSIAVTPSAYAVGGGIGVVGPGGSSGGSGKPYTNWVFTNMGSVSDNGYRGIENKVDVDAQRWNLKAKKAWLKQAENQARFSFSVGGYNIPNQYGDPSGGIKAGFTRQINTAIYKAIQNCKTRNNGTCTDPYLIAVGSVLVQGGSDGIGGIYNGPSADGFMATEGLFLSQATNSFKFKDNEITVRTKFNKSNETIGTMADNIQKTRVHMIAIVVSNEDLVVKGYYPTWNVTRRADVASANTLNTTTLDPCAAYYYVNATGIDGHVKGLTTKTTKYITPYGKLYDAIQTGGSWTSETGKTYGPFKGDWAKQTDRVNEVKEARDVSCAETQKMTIQYNLGDHVDGGQESTEGSSPSVTLKSKDEFTKAYAKGGIYKVTKQARNATITVKTTTVKYYLRDSARVDFTGWKVCKEGQTINASDMISNMGRLNGLTGSNAFNLGALQKWNGNKCGYIGNTEPPAFTVDGIKSAYKWDDVGKWLNPGANKTIGLWYGNYGQNDGWMLSNNQDRTETEVKALSANGGNEITMNTGNNKYVVGKAFNRGYPTKWNCGGKIFTSDQLGKDVDPGSCSIESINDFKFTNEVLGEYVRENGNVIWKWKAGGKEAFFQGSALKNSTGLGILNNALAPVSNSLQSIIAVAYQDFVNINCNQKDFEALINSLRDQQIANGIPQDQAIRVVSSTKFNGTAQTGVITKDIVPSLAEIVPRALGSTMMNGKTINGLGIEQVTGKDNPVIDGQEWTTYRGINGKYNVGYNAEKDPVYSKECPLDCVADSRQNDTAKSNVLSNGASQDDIAKGATGVKAQPSTSDGSLGSPVNTANMQFFRNNEWNQFKVDLYTPVAGGTAPGQVSYDGRAAKSTVINRNDGTPWFSTNGTVLTEMQASQAGSWTPIFNVANKAAAEIKDAPTQTQYGMSTTGTDRAFHVQLAGQVNDFRIKSSWATENGNPLKFQFKWEYDVQNHVSVPDAVSFRGTGTPNGNDTIINLKTVSTGVDGKCLSQQNTKLPSPDTTVLNHASSGSGTQNTDDRQFSDPGLGIDQRGWISVTFVRAAAE